MPSLMHYLRGSRTINALISDHHPPLQKTILDLNRQMPSVIQSMGPFGAGERLRGSHVTPDAQSLCRAVMPGDGRGLWARGWRQPLAHNPLLNASHSVQDCSRPLPSVMQ